MFKQILIPTDGSRVAAKAVRAGIKLAKEMGAQVVGYSAFEPVPAQVYPGYYINRTMSELLEQSARAAARKRVVKIGQAAARAGVRYRLGVGKAADPADGIVQTAKRQGCDAIFMASHGHGPVASLVLGSVTQKVLARSKLPVVIYR